MDWQGEQPTDVTPFQFQELKGGATDVFATAKEIELLKKILAIVCQQFPLTPLQNLLRLSDEVVAFPDDFIDLFNPAHLGEQGGIEIVGNPVGAPGQFRLDHLDGLDHGEIVLHLGVFQIELLPVSLEAIADLLERPTQILDLTIVEGGKIRGILGLTIDQKQ